MHRIDTPTAQKDKFGQGKNGFTRGNPQTGTLATKMDYLYFDAIQEEIVNVIESAGIALNKEKHDQLKIAIQRHVKNGQIKLSSATNSGSETEAATPLAVKKVNDNAVKKTGDTMTGLLTISDGNNSGLRLTNEAGHIWQIRTYTDGRLGVEHYNAATKKWTMHLRYIESVNKWSFENIDDVLINGKSALKVGDGGLLSNTQTIKDVFAPEIATGFYRFDANSINTPFKGLGYVNKISWNANESAVIAYGYNTNRLFIGYKDKSTGDVKYSELLKRGDYGIGDLIGAKTNNFNSRLAGGFYQANTANFSNLPFDGGPSASTLLAFPSENLEWKVEQLSVAHSNIPRIFYRCDTKNGKKEWYESITTANINQILPVGIPMPWPTKTPPAGWFECNGAPFDKNKYKKLAIAYPSGRLPDLRGEFIRGWDNGRGVNPNRVILSWEECAIQRHNHSQNIRSCGEAGRGNPWGSGGDDRFENDYRFVTGDTGGNETRPRNIAFMYIVKAE